jgi:O-antigen/teichoic acid export membrane protein
VARRRLSLAAPSFGLARLLVLGGARLLAAALAAAAMLLAARAAGPAALGAWSLALAVQGHALHLGELGLRSVVTAEAVRTRGGARALVGPYLRLRLPISAAVVLAALALTALVAPEHLGLVALTLASLPLVALQLDWVPLCEGRALAAAAPLVARPLAFLAFVATLAAPAAPLDLAACFVGAWAAAAGLSLLLLGRPRGAGPGAAPPSPLPMLRRGMGFAAVTLLSQAQLSADLVAVGAVLGVAAAGPYYVAAGVAVAASVLANAAGQLALARLGLWRDRPRRLAAALRRRLRLALVLGAVTAAALSLMAPALPRLLGDGFAGTTPVLLALAPWLLLAHPTAVLQAALGAAGRQREVLGANIAMALMLTPALGVAALAAEPWAFALARAAAEAARLSLLLRSAGLHPGPWRHGPGRGRPQISRMKSLPPAGSSVTLTASRNT